MVNKRTLALVFLMVFVVSFATVAQAFTPREPVITEMPAVSWIEGNRIYVAVSNEDINRAEYTIELINSNQRLRPVIEKRNVVVPGRSVLVESFDLHMFGVRSTAPDIVYISSNYQRTVVPVQTSDLYNVSSYVVAARERFDVTVSLADLLEGETGFQLIVDNEYFVKGTNATGEISVEHVYGGLKKVPGRQNIFEYEQPSLVLGMRAPRMLGTGVLTFDMVRAISEGRTTYRDIIPGPMILVYGTDMRFINNTGF